MDNATHGAYSDRVIRRLLLLLVPTALVVTPVVARSATILFDASFSMSLPAAESTRFEVLARELRAWMRSQPPETRYSLLIAEHGATPVRELAYPATAEQVSSALDEIVPWGAVDLGGAIAEAGRLAASIVGERGGRTTRLVVVSDGEDLAALTGDEWDPIPENVALTTLLLPARTATGIHGALAAIASRGDPSAAGDAEPEETAAGGDDAPSYRTSPDDAPKRPAHEDVPARSTAGPADRTRASLLLRWARPARWLFLAGAALGFVAVYRAAARHRRRVRAVLDHNERPPTLRVEIRGPSGHAEMAISEYPIALGEGAASALHHDLGDASPAVRLDRAENEIVLTASEKVRVNGVGRTEHTLGEGNLIRLGAVRIVVRELSRPKPLRPPRPRHRLYPLAPAASAAIAALAFAISTHAEPAAPSTSAEAAAPRTSAEAAQQAAAVERERPIAPTESPASTTPRLVPPDVVAPGEPVPEMDIDYLAVHAHPDDESLDFGGLIARMSAAGLHGAVLLLTDGNAGLDQYPWRATDATYPAHDLADDALARVRIDEAREAIGWLGADLYIRYGLPNHPYSSVEEVLEPREVLDRWGGIDELSARLRSIIAALTPQIVIAPDGPAGPSGPIEHFEHEATGLLVDRVLETLPDRSPVRLVLRSVDPLQTDGYDELSALEPYEPGADGTIPRLRQMFALRAHRTQRDATVIGVETRLTVPCEYYRLEPRVRDAHTLASALGLARVDPEGSRPYPIPERRTHEHNP